MASKIVDIGTDDLRALVPDIVRLTCDLKNTHTSETEAPVNYAAVFSHRRGDYKSLLSVARQLGTVVKETPTGPPVPSIDPHRRRPASTLENPGAGQDQTRKW
ncbi:MAG: hypothetical protein HYY50_02165 [Candidatus Kerfeldbacteria bacterium]|nr:hypothetical protein [Candidatus Kerfeldbacteria bacterium]